MQVYSSAIVERTVLRASRSFIGARLPPLFLHLPLEQTLEIDDCTEFALGQLLYERRAGKPHARSLPKNAREWAQEQPELCALPVEISREEHERVVAERDELSRQVARLTAQLAAATARDVDH